jgi:hypothetical protein
VGDHVVDGIDRRLREAAVKQQASGRRHGPQSLPELPHDDICRPKCLWVSIGIQSGALIGVQKGPLWREGSWPEAAWLSSLRSRLGPAFQPSSDAGLEARALVAGFDGEPLRRHWFEPNGERSNV